MSASFHKNVWLYGGVMVMGGCGGDDERSFKVSGGD